MSVENVINGLNMSRILEKWHNIPGFYDVGQKFDWVKDGFPICNYYYPNILLVGNVYLFTVLIYKQFLYHAESSSKPPHNILKHMSRLWNFVWFIFSTMGFLGSLPMLSEITNINPLGKGTIYFWVFLYVFTKPLEIVDTILLMLNGKDVRLIHWSHHNITMIYTWYISLRFNSLAILFAVINLGVHSIMYFYYFLMSFDSLKKFLYRISFSITAIQILQFVICITYTIYFRDRLQGSIFWYTCMMYLYYFVLFVHLYRNRTKKII